MNDFARERKYLPVHNAGLVLCAPYFPSLFGRMGLLDESRRNFKDQDHQIKAIFAMQRLVTDQEEIPACDLTLNKLIAGYPINDPLPSICSFSPDELELISSLMAAVLGNWSKMRNVSQQGFKDAFVIREGRLEEDDSRWSLEVSERAIDVLLETLPWGYKLIKSPWMSKTIFVNWR